jgi:glycosyltransferase involved in cell wall biosynthesis
MAINGKLYISACMMVKDEEKNLARCLESIKDFADEIIIVDTGSEDRTIEIARSFGPSVKIYEHPWQKDFSLHRNQSLSYATGHWILVIDADEELVLPDTPAKVKAHIKTIEKNAAGIVIEDVQKGEISMQFNSTRLFRRGFVEYRGSVHNQPFLTDGTAEGVFFPFAKIKHYGYDLTPEEKQKKFDRTSELLIARIEKDPDDYMAYFYLTQLYGDRQDLAKSCEYGEKYIEFKGREPFNESIYFTMIRNHQMLGNKDEALRWLKLGAAALPGDLDIAYATTDFGVWQRDNDLIVRGARNYLKAYAEQGKNPLKNDKRFLYSFKVSLLAFVTFALAMAHYFEGAKATGVLGQIIDQVEPGFRDQIIRNFHESLETIMIPMTVKFPPDKEEVEERKQGFAQAHLQ